MKPAKPGRPPMNGVTMRRVLVTLDPATIRRAQQAGHGNLSAGIRALAARPARQARKDPP